MPGRTTTSALGAAVLLTATALTACGDDSPAPANEAVTSTAAATTPPTTTTTEEECTAGDADPAGLGGALVSAVPDGFVRLPDDVGDTGPSDLEKAVRDDLDPDAREVLVELRFRRGYQRQWANADDHRLIVFLYEFCDEAGAEGYLDDTVAGSGGPEVEQFRPDIPEADVGFRAVEDGFGFVVLIGSAGPYLVQVVVNGSTETGSIDIFLDQAEVVLASQLRTLA